MWKGNSEGDVEGEQWFKYRGREAVDCCRHQMLATGLPGPRKCCAWYIAAAQIQEGISTHSHAHKLQNRLREFLMSNFSKKGWSLKCLRQTCAFPESLHSDVSLFSFTENISPEEKAKKNANKPVLDEIVPVYRRDCHEEVYAGSHQYPGRGVYLLKFDNSYSLWRSKSVYYRVYYTR